MLDLRYSLDDVYGELGRKLHVKGTISRFWCYHWLRNLSSEEGIQMAVILLELLPEYPQSFTGRLKNDRLLVRDVLSPIRGVGPKKRGIIVGESCIEETEQLIDLTEGQRTKLQEVLKTFLPT